MLRPPSLRSTVTTLAAAAVLVGGADLASYAATGSPLVLGHANSTAATTSIANAGHGPALSLHSAKNVAPLVVDSSTLVKHLNAARLGGRTATQVNPDTTIYQIGKAPGATIGSKSRIFQIKAPAGEQQYSMNGIWTSDVNADSITCVLWDKRAIKDTNNIKYIYALFQATLSDPGSNFINQSGYAHFGKHQKLVLGCSTDDDAGIVKVAQPITFSFHKVTAHFAHGDPLPTSRGALHRRLQLR
jgi:hypothetical protein